MENLDITKFDPTVEELKRLVSVSKKIQKVDIEDKTQIEAVKKSRIELKTARVSITKKGKELREEALTFQRAVIAKEKELIGIIEPEELRLKSIEEEATELQARKLRLEELPFRKEELAKIGDNITVTDDELLAMDTEQFFAYRNERTVNKNEADRLALEEKERKIKEEEERQQRERETQEREKKARAEAQAEAERQLKLAKEEAELRIQQEKEEAERRVVAERERMEREQREKEEREAKEKAEAERLAKEEQDKLEKQKKYQAWLKENNYNETTDKIINGESDITLYRTVSVFKK